MLNTLLVNERQKQVRRADPLPRGQQTHLPLMAPRRESAFARIYSEFSSVNLSSSENRRNRLLPRSPYRIAWMHRIFTEGFCSCIPCMIRLQLPLYWILLILYDHTYSFESAWKIPIPASSLVNWKTRVLIMIKRLAQRTLFKNTLCAFSPATRAPLYHIFLLYGGISNQGFGAGEQGVGYN